VAGLAISIPLIIFGSTMLMKVMERFPLIITAGAGLLGFLAGEMILTDPAVSQRIGEVPHALVQVAGAVGAAMVVATAMYLNKRRRQQHDEVTA
jgi:predicted tellurium resistance membrane protein TerC